MSNRPIGNDVVTHVPTPRCTSLQRSTESFNPNELLIVGAKQIISLFIPVTICMFFVVLVATMVEYYATTEVYLIYTPFHTPDADLATQTWQTIANTLIFMAVVVVTTCILVLLFKYNCYRFIHGWLVMTTFVLLFLVSFSFFTQLFRAMGVFVDYITVAMVLWNFGATGMIVIHWRGPLLLQQAYLIFISAQLALMFLKYLPKWTCWVLLGALAIWDLIAVLCPRGPLRMLVEMAHERNQPLFPALVYSTTAVYMVTENPSSQNEAEHLPSPSSSENRVSRGSASGIHDLASGEPMDELNHSTAHQSPIHPIGEAPSSSPNADSEYHSSRIDTPKGPTDNIHQQPASDRWRGVQADLRNREERGVKLGLGDFVFYSLLIGRATLDGDSITVVTCYVAILVGMCVTIIFLGITGRALPALPISVTCGILFYFVTSKAISPFLDTLALERLFF